MLEQVVILGKGRGMIATQDIKRGTRIISEEPLIAIKSENNECLLKAFLQLSESQHDQLTELSGNKHKLSLEVCKDFAIELEKSHQYSGKHLEAAVRDFARMHNSKTHPKDTRLYLARSNISQSFGSTR